jgi:tetratricopeptide (TPR) repeat protein
MKNLTLKVSGLAIAMMLAVPAVSMAQGMGQNSGMGSGMGSGMSTPPNQAQQAQDTKQAAPATPAPPALDPKEEADFKKVSAMQGAKPDDVAKAGEAFAKAYPKSNHLETVYSILAGVYMQLGDENNMFKYGNLTLQLNKDNVDALAVMSVATARKIDPDNRADALQKEKNVEDWSGRCISTLQALVKPDNVTDADFARSRDGKLAMCYSGLGQTVLFEGKVGDAVKDLSAATKLEGSVPDPVDLYLLGMAYQANRQYSDAVTVFQQCVKDTDTRMVPMCTEQMNNAKKEAAKAGK